MLTKDAILNLATEANKSSVGLTAAVRSLFSAGTDPQTLAPLVDAVAIGNKEQSAIIKSTVSRVSKEVTGTRWGFKDGSLRPTEGSGGRPAATTEDKVRKLIKADGWKAVLDAVYTIATKDAEAARELLAVVRVLSPKAE